MSLRVGSLCSGCGGLDLAVESVLGAELAWYAQYEPPDKDGKPDRHQYAARIMAHHWPGVPNHGDITAIDYAWVEPVDVVVAGWPCQDMSLAGKRKGLMPGTRSGLWTHVARAVGALRPSLVVLENVRSLTSAKAHSDLEPCAWCVGDPGGDGAPVPALRALGCVLGDLADLGFDAQWQVLPASRAGAPHKRERVFVLAWPAAEDADLATRGERRLAAPGQAQGRGARADARGRGRAPAAHAQGFGRGERRPESAGIVRGPDAAERRGTTAADAEGPRREGPRPESEGDRPQRGGGAPADPDGGGRRPLEHRDAERQRDTAWGGYEPAIRRWERALGRHAPSPVDDRGRLAPRFVEWMMGLPAGWVTEVPGIPRPAQLKALGNGVVPQQAAHALRLLLADADHLATAAAAA